MPFPFRLPAVSLVLALLLFGGCAQMQRPEASVGHGSLEGNRYPAQRRTAQESGTQTDSRRPDDDATKLARRVHELVNMAREQHGQGALAWDGKLAAIARKHSADMADEGYFSHVNRRSEDPTARARNDGYSCEKAVGNEMYVGVAENLYMTGLYSRWATVRNASGEPTKKYYWKSGEEVALEVVRGWLESRGHRENLLHSRYASEGIGVVVTEDFRVFVTQNFC